MAFELVFLEITEEDIEEGRNSNPYRRSTQCPAAIALGRQYPEASHVSVGISSAGFRMFGYELSLLTTIELQDQITRFDTTEKMDSGVYLLTNGIMMEEKYARKN